MSIQTQMNPVNVTTQGYLQDACPVCAGIRIAYVFTFKEHSVWQCSGCQTMFLNPQPGDALLRQIYSEDYFLGENTETDQQQREEMKRATARLYLNQLFAYRQEHGGNLLEIGCGQGEFLIEAEVLGYNVTGIEYSNHAASVAQSKLRHGNVIVGDLETADLPSRSFDVIVNVDVIEHVRNPRALMDEIHRVLKSGGVLLTITVSLDSWTARMLKHNWMEFKIEHLSYFSNNALQGLMFSSGFEHVRLQPTYKILTPKYILAHFERYRVPFFTPLLRLGYRILPPVLRDYQMHLYGSGVTVLARSREIPDMRKLSVIVPVYNEANTAKQMLDALLDLRLQDADKEVIIVESNSTDGTREIVETYKDHPEVKIIYQERPRGKGFAVRTGFDHATGDMILIQDADLEYDLNDYAKLLEPLMAGQRPFVLGSRHLQGSSWNIRAFEGSLSIAALMNLGHFIFCTLLNLIYGQSLKDPFTMYKVFYRDCIHGLRFDSNRFDFDFELVIKLLRKGYTPLEIPVNYRSRAPKDGKKVSVLRDPITWVIALIKFRFAPLYKSDR